MRAAQEKAPLDVRALSQAGKTLGEGKLTFINNQVVATTGTDTLYATFPNSDRALWPGAFVTVDLILGVRHDALTVPVQRHVGSRRRLCLHGARRTTWSTTSLSWWPTRQNGLVVVTKGVSPGETVVVNGQYNLANNVKVAVEKPAAPTKPTAQAPVASAKPAGSPP